MITVTHACTMNGRVHGEIKDRFKSAEEVVRERLALLDGTKRFAFSLWRLPPGMPFDTVDLDRWPQEYLQAAGSQERMTLEVRRAAAQGYEQFIIGHPDRTNTTLTSVAWAEHEAAIFECELFTGSEAAEVFAAYLHADHVPDCYTLRRL